MFIARDGRLQPVWAFIVALLFSVLAFFTAGYVAEFLAGERYLVFEVVFRALLAALLVVVFLWLLIVADHVKQDRIAALGFPRQRSSAKQFAIGCLIGLALTIVAVVPVFIWGNTTTKWRLTWHNSSRLGAVLLALLLGALAEELMFRGYPFQHLERGIGASGAIMVFSVMFGLVHLSNPGASPWGLLNTVLIGILLAIAYLRTRSLWLPWGIHFGWNASLGVLFGLPVSGLRIFNVVIRTTADLPLWLTGGRYGVEASATGAVAVLLGVLLIWKLPVPISTHAAPTGAESKCHGGLSGIQP